MDISNSPKPPKNEGGKSEDKSWWQPGLILFGKLSGWIVGPVVVSLFIGSWLDKKYDKSPWLTLVCVAVAFVISMFGIVIEAIQVMNKIEKDNKKGDKIRGKKQDGGNLKNGDREHNNSN